MSFPRYERYKESGLEWLGVVPEHWEVTRVKRLATKIGSGKTPRGGSEVYVSNGVIFLRSQNVHDTGLRLDDVVYISLEMDEEMDNTRVQAGDILLNVTGASISRTTIVPPSLGAANVSQHVCIIRIPNSDFRTFLALAMQGHAIRSQIGLAQNGAAREGLNFEQIGNITFALPPSGAEFHAITNFLCHELQQMHVLIEEQCRLIDLLKEKRQAVISHAVTKGLNPEVRLKKSGSNWLGLIPHHWNSGVLVRCASRIVVGIAEAATHAYADEGVPILRSTNIRAGKIIGDILRILPEFAADRGSKLINSNDLITVRTGNAGVTAVVPREFDRCQCFTMLITSLADQAVPEFYCYYMNSDIATAYFGVEGWGTAQVNISVPILKALPIPIPPKREQQSIVRYLDTEVGRIDELTSEAEKVVSLLHERRSALISAAVTGKIDVRNYTPRKTA